MSGKMSEGMAGGMRRGMGEERKDKKERKEKMREKREKREKRENREGVGGCSATVVWCL
jgi:hypothetical protein